MPGVYTKICYFIEWIKDEIDKFEDIDNHIVDGFQDDGSLDFWKSNGLNSIQYIRDRYEKRDYLDLLKPFVYLSRLFW